MTARSIGTVGLAGCLYCGVAFRPKWTEKDECPCCGSPFDPEEVP